MALPDVTVTIQDGALGLVSTSADQTHAIFATSAGGTANTVYTFGDPVSARATLIGGPALEAAAHTLDVAGGPVIVVPLTQTTPGTAGTDGVNRLVTQTGSGPTLSIPATSAVISTGTAPPAMTLSGTPSVFVDLVVKITLTGARGTATFKYSLDGGTTYSGDILTAATYVLGTTGLTLNFPVGAYTDDNVYTASTCIPYDSYEVKVLVVDGGALGTATFQVCLDSGADSPSYSAVITTPPSTAPTYVDSATGITITFAAGTYVAGTTYAFTCTAPAYNATSVQNAFAALTANPTEFGFVHLVGQAASTSASATMASVLSTLLEGAASSYRFTFAILEAPDDEVASNANLRSAFASFVSTRVCVAAGFERLTSSVDGRSAKRSSGFSLAARLSKVSIGVDPGRVIDGALPGVVKLLHDEQVTPNLDSARFSSLRSIVGRIGAFVTNGRMMAEPGSDFTYVQYRRVMDRGCKTARDSLLDFLNEGVRTNANGTIYELDARAIEAAVDSDLAAALVQPGHATAAQCVISRTNNVQSTQTLLAQVRITPLGYAKQITLDIGFANPSLQLTT